MKNSVNATVHDFWWGNKTILILLTASSFGTFILQIIEMKKG